MAFDIKAKINELVDKIKGNPDLLEDFKKDPVRTIEGLIGVDLPDDIVEKVVDGVKAKMDLDSLKDKLGGLGGLFKK